MKTAGILLIMGLFGGYLFRYDYQVKVIGAMQNIMQRGDLSAKVAVDTLLPDKNLYGLGPVAGLKGEIMILDGVVYSCSVTDGKLVARQSPEVKAAMLVYTQVNDWQTVAVDTGVDHYAMLEKAVETYAKANKIDTDKPFPFMLTGKVSKATYHVIDWQPGTKHTMANHKQFARKGQLNNEIVTILGFYSTRHHAVFTHHTTNMHLHIMDQQQTVVGHLDEIAFTKGMILKLPE